MTSTDAIRNDLANFLVEEYDNEKQKQNSYESHDFHDNEEYDDNLDAAKDRTNHSIGYYIIFAIYKVIYFIVYLIKKILYFIYLYIKTFIIMSLNFLWKVTKYLASLYRPSVNFIDNYTTKTLKTFFDILNHISYTASIKLYNYGKSKKYYKVKVGEKKYSDFDLARMASGIGEYENLTLKDIQDRFHIGYDTAIKVRKMRGDGLRMLNLLKQMLETERAENNL